MRRVTVIGLHAESENALCFIAIQPFAAQAYELFFVLFFQARVAEDLRRFARKIKQLRLNMKMLNLARHSSDESGTDRDGDKRAVAS